jgi:NTP pyrophosphatase (non-canonical NTP hydrolase)
MGNDDFLEFISSVSEHLVKQNPDLYAEVERRVYAQVVKLGEEVGELNEAILAHFSRQRSSKSVKDYNIAAELADIIIVAYIIGHSLGIDVQKALQQRMTTLTARHSKEPQK